jgi:hypothetical protein
MSVLLIRMKNATGAAHAWVGQEIQPGEYYELQSNGKEAWENDADVLYSIEHGELVVNDGYNDLTPEDGLLRLQAETEAQKILFSQIDFKAKEVRTAVSEASTRCTGLIGFAHSASFAKEGVLLSSSTLKRTGSLTAEFYPNPFGSILRAISFVAKKDSTPDFDLQVYSRKDGKVLLREEIRIRRHWYGYFTLVNGAGICPGSLISVYVKRQGNPPEDLCVDLMFQAICDHKTNFSGGY